MSKNYPPPFWERKKLSEMTQDEWESLCDGCGICCLNKFEEDDGSIAHTDVACKLLDLQQCSCTDYQNRQKFVPDCIRLTPKNIAKMDYLPPTCAYRLLHKKQPLPRWHHLMCGSRKRVHDLGISARGRCVSEAGMSEEEVEYRIVTWPGDPEVERNEDRRK